ncbi:hypothetical protein BDN67DRAFT_1017685 [Paxillus ammoniavirescens]|nr:hypothetical protein BDN67DRAFT_1017685 [Paxillus ammoniavirescens]
MFSRPPGPPFFVASINDNNTTFLDGGTEPISEFVQPAATAPLDLSLWHRRLAHHHVAGVKVLIEHDMVTGLKLEVKTPPDPLSYRTFTGYCYWATFIDDYSWYRFVLPMHAKSDLFPAFKEFKAYAENQSE